MCLVWGQRSWRQCLGERGSGGQQSLLPTSCWQDCPLGVLGDSRHSPRTCPRLPVAKFWITQASRWIMQCTEFKRKGLSESTLIQLYKWERENDSMGKITTLQSLTKQPGRQRAQRGSCHMEGRGVLERRNQPQVTNGRADVYQGQPASKLNPSPIRTPSTLFFFNLI